ncbi:DUF1826 domain-containing protein [Blastomonas sp.]|uniref:DUF1826 domain-containing protein n=1 Tax=Blastomonas sp. TaxID=1909299 RepID=UPI00391DDDD4
MTQLETRARPAVSYNNWKAIDDPAVRIVIDEAFISLLRDVTDSLLAAAPFSHAVSGTPEAMVAQLPSLSKELADAITDLATRFAGLMHCDTVRLRLEGITGNACRKVHADYTDLRLICTLAGPGTDYTLGDDPAGPLLSIPTGAVALFKGREFGAGHAACLHRSPPIEGTGLSRLVLVIDTPQRPRTD